MNPYQDVKEFHEATGLTVKEKLDLYPTMTDLRLRAKLHREEYRELQEGINLLIDAEDDGEAYSALVEIADGIADLIYVVAGTAVTLGIPLENVWAEVQRSNMSKIGPDGVKRRDDGKILKPDTFSPALIEPILNNAR